LPVSLQKVAGCTQDMMMLISWYLPSIKNIIAIS
jgi:hypothetical protein